MITNDFVQYLAMVRQDYTGVDGVIDSVDDLMDSVHHLQHDLLDKVKSQLTMRNVNISIKRLESIQTMGQYSTDSLSERLSVIDVHYQEEFFLGDELSDTLFKPTFVEDLLNFSPLLEDEFNLMLLDVSESIERLYKVIADDVYSDIRSMSVKKESKPLSYLTYLSSRLKDMTDMLHDIVEGQEVDYRIDEIDKEAVIRMRELIHYNVLAPNESLYLYTGNLTNDGVDDLLRVDAHFVGSLLEDGYVSMKKRHQSVPINQRVAITLKENNIDRSDLFKHSELDYDVNGVLRIMMDGIISRLATNRDGKLVLINTL